IVVLIVGIALAAWKITSLRASSAAAAHHPEQMEVVTTAVAAPRETRASATAVGTVLALRSITLRNELAGTVHAVDLVPGRIVDSGAVLVALDVAVENADLSAQQAQAALAQTTLDRLQRLARSQATSQEEVDRARAELTVAQAQVERIRAIIGR